MPDIQLSFAKIVATPTETAWSQAYNAGSLFGVLSLKTEKEDPENTLNSLGKDVFTNLQTEFYSLEDKSLTTIKSAIEKSYSHVPDSITLSFCVAFIKQDILYIFLTGNGKVAIKRSGHVGILLEKTTVTGKEVTTASGYLQNGDIIVLQTQQFASMVTQDQLTSALDSTIPNEIAETLTPQIHQVPEGGASGLILNFIGIPKPEPIISQSPDVTLSDTAPITPNPPPPPPVVNPTPQIPVTPEKRAFPRFQLSVPSFIPYIPMKQRVIIGIIVLLIIVLLTGVVMVKKQQSTKQNQSLFTTVYTTAQKKYTEGEGLIELNKPLASDSFTAAENTITTSLSTFPKNSEEYAKLSDLLKKIKDALAKTQGNASLPTKQVDAKTSPLLNAILTTTEAITGVSDTNGVTLLTPKAILSDGKELIRNDSDWSNAIGLGTFLGNFYVLDTKNGVLKFSNSGSSFSKSSYFSGDAPDLSAASNMSIDGSIWILYTTGSIEKYTKGAKDTFTVKGLTTPLSKPTRIVTTSDTQNLYILDPGSSRIVVLKKDGTFQTQYKADILTDAKEIDIQEKDKKAYILSGKNVYELAL